MSQLVFGGLEETMEVSRRTGVLFVFIAAVLYSIGGLCIKVIPWSGIAINGGHFWRPPGTRPV